MMFDFCFQKLHNFLLNQRRIPEGSAVADRILEWSASDPHGTYGLYHLPLGQADPVNKTGYYSSGWVSNQLSLSYSKWQ